MTPEAAAAWLAEACFRVNVLAYGLPVQSDSTGAGIGAGTRRLLWYGPTAMPGNVGPAQQWEDLLARAGAPALPLPPDWDRRAQRTEGDDQLGDLTATTPPGPPSPGPVAPRRSLEDLRSLAMHQAAALMQWAGNQTAAGAAQAAVVQIVNTFGSIVDTVSRRLVTLRESAERQARDTGAMVTRELQEWLGVWAAGSYQLWQQAVAALHEVAHGLGTGIGLGSVLLLGLAVYLMTRKS